ncbi:MAG: hypothetical protein ACTSYZ_08525 [Candidatus Helarchaeota archaeon]
MKIKIVDIKEDIKEKIDLINENIESIKWSVDSISMDKNLLENIDEIVKNSRKLKRKATKKVLNGLKSELKRNMNQLLEINKKINNEEIIKYLNEQYQITLNLLELLDIIENELKYS